MRRGAPAAQETGSPTPVPTTPGRGTRLGTQVRGRLRSVDPVLGIVGLGSFVVYMLHGFNAALTRDLGVYTYGGQRFLAGDPPYVGILNRAGPLAHALPGIGIWLGRRVGIADIHGARGFFMLMAIGCVCLVYVVVRDLTRSRGAAVVGAVAFLGFQGFLGYATDGPREKTAMVLFLLAAVLAMIHRRWATCGVFIALGTLTWQPVFFLILVSVIVAVLLSPDRRVSALVRVTVGGAATSAVVLLYYAANGALHTFFDGFLLINAQYTRQPSPFGRHFPKTWASLKDGYGLSVWVIVVGLVAIVILGVASARAAWRTRELAPVGYLSLGAGCLAGLAWSAKAFNAWPDLFLMLPLAAIGVGGGVAVVLRRLDLRVAVAVTAVLALVGTAYATQYSLHRDKHNLAQQRAVIGRVLRLGPQSATILSVQAPEVLVMTHRVNPTPYQMYDNGFTDYLKDTYPGGIQGYLASIQRSAPTYIVVQTGMHPAWLMPWLRQHYDNVRGAPQFNFWVDRSVSHEARKKMRLENRAARVRLRS